MRGGVTAALFKLNKMTLKTYTAKYWFPVLETYCTFELNAPNKDVALTNARDGLRSHKIQFERLVILDK